MHSNKWKFVKLEDLITDIKNGFACGKRDQNGIVQIRMNNVTIDGKLTFDKYLKVPVPQTIDAFQLRKGDFLFNNTNSIDLVGKSTIFSSAPFPCTFSNHFNRIRFNEKIVDSKFVLFHFLLLWMKGYFKSVAIRHVGQAAVQKKYIQKIKIPLPPLHEQKKIAEILSTVDLAIKKTDEAIKKIEILFNGLLKYLFHNCIKNSRPKLIKDLSISIVGGGTPSTSKSEFWNGDIAWMTSAHILSRDLVNGQKYITKTGLEKSSSNLVPKNNVIIATRVGIGKVALNKIDIAISQDLTGIIIYHDKIVPDFLYYFLLTQKSKLKALAQGSTIKGILREDLRKLKIPLPSISIQKKIVATLNSFYEKQELLIVKKEKLKQIKKGLMNDLLTGHKRVRLES